MQIPTSTPSQLGRPRPRAHLKLQLQGPKASRAFAASLQNTSNFGRTTCSLCYMFLSPTAFQSCLGCCSLTVTLLPLLKAVSSSCDDVGRWLAHICCKGVMTVVLVMAVLPLSLLCAIVLQVSSQPQHMTPHRLLWYRTRLGVGL